VSATTTPPSLCASPTASQLPALLHDAAASVSPRRPTSKAALGIPADMRTTAPPPALYPTPMHCRVFTHASPDSKAAVPGTARTLTALDPAAACVNPLRLSPVASPADIITKENLRTNTSDGIVPRAHHAASARPYPYQSRQPLPHDTQGNATRERQVSPPRRSCVRAPRHVDAHESGVGSRDLE